MKQFLRTKQSYLIAFAVLGGVVAWMMSGVTGASDSDRAAPAVAQPAPEQAFRVRVRTLESRAVERQVIVRGRTAPSRTVTIRAEIDARVETIEAERGSRLAGGDTIVLLDPRARQALLREAHAAVRQREIQFEAFKRLEDRQFQSKTGLAEAFAALEAARAAVERVEVEIGNTRVSAPFAGILERRPVEVGDYVSMGDEVARVLQTDPILVKGYLAQHELGRFGIGAPGTATLISGAQVDGFVRFVASESDPETGTFMVELEAPNPGGTIASGVTAEIRVPTGTVQAHLLSPALLSLDSKDRLGIKSVGEDGVVEFRPVQIVRAGPEGIWVAGLPRTIAIITVGQGFVHAGDVVEAVPERRNGSAEPS